MISWWKERTISEKKFLFLTTYFFLGLIFYIFISFYFHSKETMLLSQIQKQTELLNWINNRSYIILNKKTSLLKKSRKNLFTLIEDTFKHSSSFHENVSLTEISKNKISISFKQVSFDKLITTLVSLWINEGIEIAELEMKKLEIPGKIEATMILIKK